MRLAIPLMPLTLDEAFAYANLLRMRTDLNVEPSMSDEQWEHAVAAAVGRRDQAGLATLVQAELAPALTRAVTALAQTTRVALAARRGSSDEHALQLAHRIETTERLVMRASKATWAAEHRIGLLPEQEGPSSPRPDANRRLLTRVVTYLHMELNGKMAHDAISEDLGLALRKLAGPVRAAVECIDEQQLDELLAHPLQAELFETYHALSSVRLFMLAAHMAEATVERIKCGLN